MEARKEDPEVGGGTLPERSAAAFLYSSSAWAPSCASSRRRTRGRLARPCAEPIGLSDPRGGWRCRQCRRCWLRLPALRSPRGRCRPVRHRRPRAPARQYRLDPEAALARARLPNSRRAFWPSRQHRPRHGLVAHSRRRGTAIARHKKLTCLGKRRMAIFAAAPITAPDRHSTDFG